LEGLRLVTYAQGHPAAFGMKFKKIEMQEIVKYFNRSLNYVSSKLIDSIVVNGDGGISVLNYDAHLIADYNEFSGADIPVAYISKRVNYGMKIYPHSNYMSIKWEDFFITAFIDVSIGDILLIKPTLTGNGIKMYVNSLG
jgi:hypothetical protein